MIFHYNKQKLYYKVIGSGEPLLLLHGIPFDSRVWDQGIDELQNLYSCILLDFPGFGNSKTPQDDSNTFYALKEIVKVLLDKLNISKCYVLGHSFGGYVAQDFAFHYPSYIQKMFLVSTKYAADFSKKKKERLHFAEELSNKKYEEYRNIQITYCQSGGKYDNFIQQVITENVDWHIAGLLKSLAGRESFIDKITSFQFPVHIIVGEDDTDFLEESKLLFKKIPHSTLDIIPHAKHMVFLDNTKEFVEKLWSHKVI